MISLAEWKLFGRKNDGNNPGGLPPPGMGTDADAYPTSVDPNALRILKKVLPQVRAEFSDEQDAIEAIALACVSALTVLGRSNSIEKVKRACHC